MVARRQQVAALLHAGFQQCEIAEQLGVSEATVSGDCAVLREQWRVAAAADYAEVAAAALAALDVDEAGLRELLGGNLSPRDRVAVYNQIGLIQERRAKWRGFDSPQRAAGVGDLVAVLALLDGEVIL
jgi:hypothetical protein